VKKTILACVVTLFVFIGCSTKIDPQSINSAIVPDKTYSTYSESKSMISQYYFKTKDGELHVRSQLAYLPMYSDDELYNPFSNIVFTLRMITDNKSKTIEDALTQEVKRNGNVKLFNDKDEHIIANDFASDLMWSIREFEDKMQRRDDRDKIFLPL